MSGTPKAPSRVTEPLSNLFTAVDIGETTLEILSYRDAPKPPAAFRLREIKLTGLRMWTSLALGSSELVVSFHDQDREIQQTYGEPGHAKGFFDQLEVDEEGVTLLGGPMPLSPDRRIIHYPIAEGSRYMSFHRRWLAREPVDTTRRKSSIAAGYLEGTDQEDEPVYLNWMVLAVYQLPGWPEPPPDPEEFPIPIPDLTLERGFFEATSIEMMEMDWPLAIQDPGGLVIGTEVLLGNGNPEGHFNVVILGDGFNANEQTCFRTYVDYAMEAFKTTAPFNQYLAKSNYFVVDTISTDSGISACPCRESEKNTYYDFHGHYVPPDSEDQESYPAYAYTKSPEKIWWTLGAQGLSYEVDLVLVITNCWVHGGSALIHNRIATASVGTYGSKNKFYFQQVVAHEAAHTLGNLGEERIPGGVVEYDETDDYQNIIHIPGGNPPNGPQPWWKDLPGVDLDGNGDIKIVYKCPSPSACKNQHNSFGYGEPIPHPDLRKVGLFWGALYQNPDPSMGIAGMPLQAGREFFRGKAYCKMRFLGWDFCEICTDVLERAIRASIV